MIKQAMAVLVSATLTTGILAGCGTSNNKSIDSVSSDSVLSEPVDITKGATEKMLERSILFEGNTSRIAEKINNALENPKKITKICFLGDSITQGSCAENYQNQYVNRFHTWWKENFGPYVEVTNAGIGATESYLGVHRVQRDVLDLKPDIIFIEFINDSNDDFYKTSMDSLVRKCLSLENNPAVIMIEMTMDTGVSAQEVHSEIAKAYGVPVISYHDAVMPEIESGSIKWADISPDNIHPNDIGHGMLAEMIENFIIRVKDKLPSLDKTSKAFDADSPTEDKYHDARLADRNSNEVKLINEGNFTETVSFQKFNAGWGTSGGGSAEFEMEFKNLGILYLKTTDGQSADVTITVDGEEVMPISGDFPGGWGDYLKSDEIYVSDKKAKHRVKISVDEGEAKNFKIISWLLS